MDNDSYYYMYGEPFGIGATAHGLYIEDRLIVVDWGIGFSKEDDGRNINYLPNGDFLKGEHVDLFVITHAHADHIGAAPRFVREHPEAIVAISQKTLELSAVIFRDFIKRMESDLEEGIISEMTFDFDDVKKFFNNPNLEVISEDGWSEEDYPWEGWQIGFHKSGHTAGAESLFIITPQNKRIMVTGDISSQDQRVIPGMMLPSEDFLGDFLDQGIITLITEGTNAGRPKQKERSVIEEELVNTVKEVAARGGTIFIPCFGLNRTSEAIHILTAAGFIVHVDGAGRKLSTIESSKVKELLDSGQVIFFEEFPEHYKARLHRTAIGLNDDPCDHGEPCTINGQYFEKEPCIVIAPSATLEGGHAVTHGINLLPGRDNAVIFIGHIFENTVAKKIQEIKRGRTIKLKNFDEEVLVNVRCDVYHFDLTAHDYQDSLVERIRLMNRESRLKQVIVHHCPNQSSFDLFEKEVGKLPNPPKSVVYGTQMTKIEI